MLRIPRIVAKYALRSLNKRSTGAYFWPNLSPCMYYVYLLRSEKQPSQTYIGFTTDLKNRFEAHNAGQSKHTSKFRPWKIETYLAFDDEQKARDFETYLKSHSGKAFAAKRLWSAKLEFSILKTENPSEGRANIPFESKDPSPANAENPIALFSEPEGISQSITTTTQSEEETNSSLKPVQISKFDLEWIVSWMESQDHIDEVFFDAETGRLFIGESELREAFGEEIAIDDDRFIYLESIDSHEGYQYMQEFAHSAEMDNRIRERLLDALDRPKPFRRFKNVLHDHEDLLDAFETHKVEQIANEFRKTLEANGYQLIETQD